MATTRTISLPKALPHQIPLLTSDARFKIAPCGRRWGKTAAGLLACVRGHGSRRGNLRGAIDGATIWWVAPTFKIASEIWRDAKRSTQYAWTDKSEVERRIELPSGGSLSIRSADDPDSLRAIGLDGVVLDEVGFINERAWKEALRPALSDKRGWAMLIGTPNGCNWLYEVFERVPARPNWERWQLPTTQNPLVPQSELDDAILDIGDRAYAQEYLAQFVDVAGAEFSGVYFGDHVWFDRWPEPRDIQFRVMFLDPSKGKTDKSDYSAFTLLALDKQGVLWIDADIKRRDAWQIVEDGNAIADWFRPHAFGVEANQFQEMFIRPFEQAAKERGKVLPIHPVVHTENKRVRIRATLTPYLARGEVRFRRTPGGKLLVAQLRQFPLGQYDDGPDSLEGCVKLTRQIFDTGRAAA
jgi:predicted phage terminase large subunit-like protein